MLENHIQELTLAVKALTARLENVSTPSVAKTVDVSTPKEPIVQEKKEEPASESSATYEDVKRVTIKLSSIEKAAAVELLAAFGCQRATQLKEEQWGAYIAQAEIKIGELS
jgi:hypothetical protein